VRVWGRPDLNYTKSVKEVKFEHYDIRYRNNNMWASLGIGRVDAKVNHDLECLTPYIRDEYVPFDL
jgi:hypothetical protein